VEDLEGTGASETVAGQGISNLIVRFVTKRGLAKPWRYVDLANFDRMDVYEGHLPNDGHF
jgi:hypothetical protein